MKGLDEIEWVFDEIEDAVHSLDRDFFRAADVHQELESNSIREVSSFLSDMSDSEKYDVYELDGLPKIFSSVGETDISGDFLYDNTEEYRKAMKLVSSLEKVSEAKISSLASHLTDSRSTAAVTRYQGKMLDNLKKHPEIEYSKEDKEYRWKK